MDTKHQLMIELVDTARKVLDTLQELIARDEGSKNKNEEGNT